MFDSFFMAGQSINLSLLPLPESSDKSTANRQMDEGLLRSTALLSTSLFSIQTMLPATVPVPVPVPVPVTVPVTVLVPILIPFPVDVFPCG